MPRGGPPWRPEEDRILIQALNEGLMSEDAAQRLASYGRTGSACLERARTLNRPFPRRGGVKAVATHQPFQPWAVTSALAKAERAKILAEARRLNLNTALPWPVIVQAVKERQAA